jgi:type I restriction enzyme, S subunit
MNEWKEHKLEEVATLVKDTYKPKAGDHLPYIGLEHIQEQALRLFDIGDSDSITSQKFRFKTNDILFGKLRPYFRKVIKPNFSGVCSTDIWVVRALEGYDQNYIFYFFANQEFVDIANSGDSGTRMPRADWNFVKDTVWQFPTLLEQTAIASVLSSLDDKIDLLHRQNETLEAMAEALWRKIFVEEADPKWSEKKLEDVCTITRGASPRPIIDYILNGTVPWIKIADATASNSYFIDKTNEFIIEAGVSKSVKVYSGDLILSNSATCGLPYFVDLEGCIHDGWLLFRNFKDVSKIFVFFFLKKLNRELNYIADGSVQNNLNTGLLKEYKLKIPPGNLFQCFDAFGDTVINRIRLNTIQIRTLSLLRDNLLPKLISGEVTVRL